MDKKLISRKVYIVLAKKLEFFKDEDVSRTL